ncbi:acetyl-CoA synthetase-like protein [Polyporus arcularius HHB13444]|uniref:Acetyl-CoA synthetase-like protein n=1 Tax=Polyporus arcularius HHB13444 TaxID=1314778 RepID=A0A5C3NSV5_9APHY|nr:acetyl-CoA synthetase-like protein [Polyporus arcularius HHB13444]
MSPPKFTSPKAVIQAGGITLPEVYEWHGKANPHFNLFCYHDGQVLHGVPYSDVVQRMRGVAQYVLSFAGPAAPAKTIGILANTDTITYALTVLGIMRAGHTAFPISLRNSTSAVAQLFQQTSCRHVLVSQDESTRTLARDAIMNMSHTVQHPLLVLDEMRSSSTGSCSPELPQLLKSSGTAIILHSSGSTNYPKPISWTHQSLLSWGTVPWYGDVDTAEAIIGCHGIPMSHAFGVSMCAHAAAVGWTLAVFPPSSSPVLPTSENVFEGTVATNVDYLMTVPVFIEQWASDSRKVGRMKRMKGIVFGGAPLHQDVGDSLASKGIALYSTYGSTEVGSVANLFTANPGMDWPYFSITPWLRSVEQEFSDGMFEIVVLSSPDHPLSVVNTKVGNTDAYATGDLVEPHPTKPGLWKVFGRKDDQIVLSNGEKTNPLPLEGIMNEDPHVRSSMLFGHGKFQNGVLINPLDAVSHDDRLALTEYRDRIWPSIERANAIAPQHSRIFKEMILVATPDKPFTYNLKGYPRRKTLEKLYSEEIDELYAEIESSAQSDIPSPSTWDAESIRHFLRAVVESTLHQPLDDEEDFFRHGCDSLQATWIRNTIFRALHHAHFSAAQRLPMDIVYEASSIATLTRALVSAIHERADVTGASTPTVLSDLAEQYLLALPRRPGPSELVERRTDAKIVLVTGTTGGFGADLLEHLLLDDSVETVYALNRKGTSAVERQTTRFHHRGLQVSLLASPKLKMVEGDLSSRGLGLPAQTLDEIKRSTTHILHNAWRVNFKLALASFETELAGLRNLIEVALSSPYTVPPKLQFVSSIGVFRDYRLSGPIQEEPAPPFAALGTGYSESKWIAEEILCKIAEREGVPVSVVRLGQLCGDRKGHWNESEWFPAMVKSSLHVGCLPDIITDAAFVPSYLAARAMVEMLNTSSRILHLLHPRPVSSRTLMESMAEALGVHIVAYSDWLSALEKIALVDGAVKELDIKLRKNPALILLDVFRTRTFDGTFSTQKAVGASQELARLPPLGPEDGRRWVSAWRSSGFL